MSNCYIGTFTSFHDNLIEYLRASIDPSMHENGLENNVDCNARIYNNVFRHLLEPRGIEGSFVTLWIAPYPTAAGFGTCTDYVFNNIFYDLSTGNFADFGMPLKSGGGDWPTAGSVNYMNNTLECGPEGALFRGPPAAVCVGCSPRYASCAIENNHFITAVSEFNLPGCGKNCANNVFQTPATANAQGYRSDEVHPFSPTAQGDATVGTGTNLSNLCSIDSDLANLCSDTTDAVSYDASNHIAISPAKSTNSRVTPLERRCVSVSRRGQSAQSSNGVDRDGSVGIIP